MTDGLGKLAAMTGLTREDVTSIANDVKANQAKLRACASHEFSAIDPSKPFATKYVCAHCAGTVDGHAYRWYLEGRKHAGAQ